MPQANVITSQNTRANQDRYANAGLQEVAGRVAVICMFGKSQVKTSMLEVEPSDMII